MSKLQKLMCAALRRALAGGRANPPEGGLILWNGFAVLSRARRVGPGGPEGIPYSEIRAWGELMAIPLEPRHVAIICAMDSVWLENARSLPPTPSGVKPLPPVSKHPLSAALLDAMTG